MLMYSKASLSPASFSSACASFLLMDSLRRLPTSTAIFMDIVLSLRVGRVATRIISACRSGHPGERQRLVAILRRNDGGGVLFQTCDRGSPIQGFTNFNVIRSDSPIAFIFACSASGPDRSGGSRWMLMSSGSFGFELISEAPANRKPARRPRSEEHTSELQSHVNLVCRLLLE